MLTQGRVGNQANQASQGSLVLVPRVGTVSSTNVYCSTNTLLHVLL